MVNADPEKPMTRPTDGITLISLLAALTTLAERGGAGEISTPPTPINVNRETSATAMPLLR